MDSCSENCMKHYWITMNSTNSTKISSNLLTFQNELPGTERLHVGNMINVAMTRTKTQSMVFILIVDLCFISNFFYSNGEHSYSFPVSQRRSKHSQRFDVFVPKRHDSKHFFVTRHWFRRRTVCCFSSFRTTYTFAYRRQIRVLTASGDNVSPGFQLSWFDVLPPDIGSPEKHW